MRILWMILLFVGCPADDPALNTLSNDEICDALTAAQEDALTLDEGCTLIGLATAAEAGILEICEAAREACLDFPAPAEPPTCDRTFDLGADCEATELDIATCLQNANAPIREIAEFGCTTTGVMAYQNREEIPDNQACSRLDTCDL